MYKIIHLQLYSRLYRYSMLPNSFDHFLFGWIHTLIEEADCAAAVQSNPHFVETIDQLKSQKTELLGHKFCKWWTRAHEVIIIGFTMSSALPLTAIRVISLCLAENCILRWWSKMEYARATGACAGSWSCSAAAGVAARHKTSERKGHLFLKKHHLHDYYKHGRHCISFFYHGLYIILLPWLIIIK